MMHPEPIHPSHTAVLTISEIKAAVEAFEDGDVNVFETLDAIVVTVEAYQASLHSDTKRDAA